MHADFRVTDVDAERTGDMLNHDGLVELFVCGDGARAACVKGGDDIHFFEMIWQHDISLYDE